MALTGLRCYKCGVRDGKPGTVVLPATDEEVLIKGVPVGVALCSECSFFDEEETALLNLIADDDHARIEAKKRLIQEELQEDLAHEAKEMASWTNKFGGW
jgi:hypothetical protein